MFGQIGPQQYSEFFAAILNIAANIDQPNWPLLMTLSEESKKTVARAMVLPPGLLSKIIKNYQPTNKDITLIKALILKEKITLDISGELSRIYNDGCLINFRTPINDLIEILGCLNVNIINPPRIDYFYNPILDDKLYQLTTNLFPKNLIATQLEEITKDKSGLISEQQQMSKIGKRPIALFELLNIILELAIEFRYFQLIDNPTKNIIDFLWPKSLEDRTESFAIRCCDRPTTVTKKVAPIDPEKYLYLKMIRGSDRKKTDGPIKWSKDISKNYSEPRLEICWADKIFAFSSTIPVQPHHLLFR